MAGIVEALGSGAGAVCGLPRLFEFTNADGALCATNCGQAAAATLLTHHGKISGAANRAREVMAALERDFPPDQFFGKFGTGRRQFERICRHYGLKLREVCGEEALRAELGAGRPVAVMLGMPAGKLLGRIDLPGGHWMVAFAHDAEQIYLSNLGGLPMTWREFRRGWYSFVPLLIGMHGRGLVVDDEPERSA